MNSTYKSLTFVLADKEYIRLTAESARQSPTSFRRWSNDANACIARYCKILSSVGPVTYGPELPRDTSRWSMTPEEWEGMGTPGLGT